MCGIAAVISNACKKEEREKWVSGMLKSMQHRGPDHSQWYSDDWVTLGHNRLSILDLSERAHQPLFSPDGRYCIVLNGEIYNYLSLRTELQRVPAGSSHATVWHFKTTSDTEVVLASFVRWKEQCLQYLKGMFAFIIYDCVEKKLFVARDRFGVKPLYYYYSDEFLVISSEIRAIIHHVPFQWKQDTSSLSLYFQYQTFFQDATPVRQIKSLLPGHYFHFSNGKAETVNYYSFQLPEQFDGTEMQAIQRMREKLLHAVERRMVSDVPVAAFLSGGIDSSVVVAAMRMVSEKPFHTFHVTFREKAYSESEVAETVAKKYSTQHEVLVCSPQQIVNELDEFLDCVDMPGGDGLNTWVISRLVHQKGIRVALSGIGGDEWALEFQFLS